MIIYKDILLRVLFITYKYINIKQVRKFEVGNPYPPHIDFSTLVEGAGLLQTSYIHIKLEPKGSLSSGQKKLMLPSKNSKYTQVKVLGECFPSCGGSAVLLSGFPPHPHVRPCCPFALSLIPKRSLITDKG
jgi:hypothetical protein